ncbi:hypothetical protein SAMN06272737_11346 [Blastococcus mobilis]|uniref:Uncharacterized protein n=1 Tax=Blastococcus mobilis TaxID=1938746 RepID=A0A238XE41_9ACTN|nr:hypothetical protein [Blastococcus mobilis]SNR57276.1 hypothetical protein SAMN06272737_11346 [Blastococcus mobilis]
MAVRGALVAEQDDAVAERAGLDQPEFPLGVRGAEERLPAAEQDRVDVEPVLVDRVEPPE